MTASRTILPLRNTVALTADTLTVWGDVEIFTTVGVASAAMGDSPTFLSGSSYALFNRFWPECLAVF
jgi:hypothetical protein